MLAMLWRENLKRNHRGIRDNQELVVENFQPSIQLLNQVYIYISKNIFGLVV